MRADIHDGRGAHAPIRDRIHRRKTASASLQTHAPQQAATLFDHLVGICGRGYRSSFFGSTPYGLTWGAPNGYADLADKPTRASERCPSTRRRTEIRSL